MGKEVFLTIRRDRIEITKIEGKNPLTFDGHKIHGEYPLPPRSAFGKGEQGEKAYKLIKNGTPCEASRYNLKGIAEKTTCGDRAIGTIDISVPGGTDVICVCQNHRWLVRSHMNQAERNGEENPIIGENGNWY